MPRQHQGLLRLLFPRYHAARSLLQSSFPAGVENRPPGGKNGWFVTAVRPADREPPSLRVFALSSQSQQDVCCLIGDPVAGNPTQYMLEKAFDAARLDWRFLTFEVEKISEVSFQ